MRNIYLLFIRAKLSINASRKINLINQQASCISNPVRFLFILETSTPKCTKFNNNLFIKHGYFLRTP